MQSLIFELKSNGNIEIQEELPYYFHQNMLHFKVENTLYEYHLEKDIFKKKEKDSVITILPKKKEMTIELLENHAVFDFPLSDISLKREDEKIEITYTFLNPEKTTNCIVINYHAKVVDKK